MLVARNGPTTLARIAVMKVLNGGLTAISDWLPRSSSCETVFVAQPLLGKKCQTVSASPKV